MDLQNQNISEVLAIKLFNSLNQQGGFPTEDRILIISKNSEQQTASGIFIPNAAKDELPKKGVVIQKGVITESYSSYGRIDIGNIVTYGNYAGKELDIKIPDFDLKGYIITVLSLNEIIYVEQNK